MSSDPSGPYVIVKGKTLNITCTIIEANPDTNIAWQWRINDTNVNVTGPNYIVSNVQRDKSGTYSCEARNSVGTSVAALTIVDVQCKFIVYRIYIFQVRPRKIFVIVYRIFNFKSYLGIYLGAFIYMYLKGKVRHILLHCSLLRFLTE